MTKEHRRDVVLAVDPGGTTGWATWRPMGKHRPAGVASSGEADFGEFVLMADDIGHRLSAVVCERYTVTQQTVRMSRQTTALEVIGFLRFLCLREGIGEPVLQQPGDAKRFASDERLKAAGWHTPGRGHANDAKRHLLTWLVKTGAMEVPR